MCFIYRRPPKGILSMEDLRIFGRSFKSSEEVLKIFYLWKTFEKSLIYGTFSKGLRFMETNFKNLLYMEGCLSVEDLHKASFCKSLREKDFLKSEFILSSICQKRHKGLHSLCYQWKPPEYILSPKEGV